MNIIITSAGQRVSLIKSFQFELKKIFPESKVFTADLNPVLAPACHISDGYFKVPRVTAENYIDEIIKICEENNIKLIIPTIDTELLMLSKNTEKFKSHNITALVSDHELIQKCRNKRLTNQLFQDHNIAVPKQYTLNNLEFPVFVKPYDGSLSKGIFIANTQDDITQEHRQNEKLMYMELISNDEFDDFTVDCYYDKNTTLKCVVPRQRLVVRAGEVNKAATRNNIIVEHFFNNIAQLKGARGCLTIQVFLHKEQPIIKGIEINPRFGGGYPLTYLSGANYSKWVLEEYLLDKEIEVYKSWEQDLLMLRYDAEVLVHDFKK